MAVKISRFYVEALHGVWTVDIPIEDNRLILVGENGSGKTTIANLLFFFLSCQWGRLSGYNFEILKLTIDNEEVMLKRSELAVLGMMPPRLFRHLSSEKSGAFTRALLQFLGSHKPGDAIHSPELYSLAEEAHVPVHLFHEMVLSTREAPGTFSQIIKLTERLTGLLQDQILYLPTYRRIEHDLSSIFPEIEEEIRKHQERTRRSQPHKQHNYIELVEFGMKDVERMIAEKMGELKDHWRNGLSKLTGTYLRDVIRGAYTSVDINRIKGVTTEALDLMLSRIEEQILPAQEKDKVRTTVGEIRSKSTISVEDRVVAHFLHKLIELHEDQQDKERRIRNFVVVCNSYMTDKQIFFDNIKFEIPILPQSQSVGSRQKKKANMKLSPLSLQMLSSGEKQIVSLFSHVYLSGHKGFIVLIDEPELSLSVPWQRKFLADILRTNQCSALFAVTHSPFIYENELDHYARSIEEFRRPINEFR